MTELERLLIGRLEQMEKQTAALELQLQRQELSLSECQRVCVEALESCGTLCGELQSGSRHCGTGSGNSTTEKALGLLSTAVGTLKPALDGLLKVRS